VETAKSAPEYSEEIVTEETEEVFVRDEIPEEEPKSDICEICETPLSEDGKCPMCQPPEEAAKASAGCPLCSSKIYTKESGDLVSCEDCGNVYVHKDFEPEGQNWKWKFWVGLVFILVGNIGIALGSYIHNVLKWSPFGKMYLGYGWFDQTVGAIGIILFVLGLFLFAWSFKREREIQCPSCKVIIRESQFEIYEPEEEEEEIPKEVSVKSALDEIGEMVECPSCGASVSMFDTSCSACGTVFEIDIAESAIEPETSSFSEPEEPGRLLSASEIDEDELIMESLELESPDKELNGNGLNGLAELESAIQMHLEEEPMGIICPACGATVGKGLDTCPGCGEPIDTTDGE
jgi:hypothetical protein